jgi:hypothetical protein
VILASPYYKYFAATRLFPTESGAGLGTPFIKNAARLPGEKTLVMMQFGRNSRYRKRDRNLAVHDRARWGAVLTGLRLISMNLNEESLQ